MINIKLNDKQTGYDAVGEYVRRYWKHNIVDSVIVRIGSSYDGVSFEIRNEVAVPYGFDDIMYEFDWWEGQRFITLYGIKLVSEIDIVGGIYEQN